MRFVSCDLFANSAAEIQLVSTGFNWYKFIASLKMSANTCCVTFHDSSVQTWSSCEQTEL